jgi:hypothetical protein
MLRTGEQYRATNFDFEPALSFVRKAAGLSDKAR